MSAYTPFLAKFNQLFHPGPRPGRRAGWFAAFGVCAFFLLGCAAPKPIKYYQVTYPSKSFVAQDSLDASLLIRPFEASHLYLDDKIVYGFDSPEMGTYEYHRWSEPPVEILQNALVRGLRSTGRYKAVYSIHADPTTRFIVGGQIYDFREVDGPNVVARLSFVVRLRDFKEGSTIWNYSYMHDEPATEKSVNAFVIAMDKNLQSGVQQVSAGLDEYFHSHPLQ
jgi:ABC-type uncharacterized transport system auxiliary subunit